MICSKISSSVGSLTIRHLFLSHFVTSTDQRIPCSDLRLVAFCRLWGVPHPAFWLCLLVWVPFVHGGDRCLWGVVSPRIICAVKTFSVEKTRASEKQRIHQNVSTVLEHSDCDVVAHGYFHEAKAASTVPSPRLSQQVRCVSTKTDNCGKCPYSARDQQASQAGFSLVLSFPA